MGELRLKDHELTPLGDKVEAEAAAAAKNTDIVLTDVVRFFEGFNAQMAVTLTDLAESSAAEYGVPPSLKITYMTPGDALYVPSSVIIIEKCLAANAVAVRVPLTLVDETTLAKLELVKSQNQRQLS